jgi:ABC-2 type transport system ATP-binding protein
MTRPVLVPAARRGKQIMKIVEFTNIHRAYRKDHEVLGGLSFSIEPGEVVGLLGKNGAGKTTLIRIAMGMLEAQQGSVRLFGLDPRENPIEVKRRVGYVSEEQILPEHLRVKEIIQLHRGLYPSWDPQLEVELRKRFDIPMDAMIKTLSRGQARQVALLCAVAHRPELLILDEPAGGLDPAVRREFLETAIELLNEAGSTILFSSHYMSDVERLAGRVVLIHDGAVLIDNDLDDLREKFTLVLVPKDSGLDRRRLASLDGCLAVRERNNTWHLILHHRLSKAREIAGRELSAAGLRCEVIPLEEMFIELVGGRP